MKPHIKEIASRIILLREEASMSQSDLAKKIHIPLCDYIAYEKGEVDFPVSVLDDIAGFFGIELSTIITGEEPKLHIFSVTRKGKGVAAKRREEYSYEALAAKFSHKNMEPFLVTVTPNSKDELFAQNAHTGKEFDYIMEGSMEIMISGKIITLEEGDSIFFDSSYPHGMKAIGEKPCKFLAIIN